ncbi:hatching enzyme 1.2-like [Uranotaenia lowii]|uniref:hatching enzyme 1.2-like n=1 Tax=Uranotaenia lowii TaxID=190385 RepID=UPI002478A171|nr:hatching enzyme 1.2-like [Uranotaenia lowii]
MKQVVFFVGFVTAFAICATLQKSNSVAFDDEYVIDFSFLGEEVYNPEHLRNRTKRALPEDVDAEGEGVISVANDTLIDVDDEQYPEQQGRYAEGDIYQPVLPRGAVKFESKLWADGVVPYVISIAFGFITRWKIKDAMYDFHQQTCIRFVPKTNEMDYLSIERSPSGCWSTIGRTGGKQVLNLQGPCLKSRGTVLHELMHALGFLHEHSRQDRDEFVRINFKNVRPDAVKNFENKDRADPLGSRYDFGSVMHYPVTAFSVNGKPTIEPKVNYTGKIGQRERLSRKDVEAINRMYC